ncbi:MAG: hypothetical protein AAI978_00480 [Candidatus Hodgkinia cicadicola]
MSSLMWSILVLDIAAKIKPLTDYAASMCKRCRYCSALSCESKTKGNK